MIEIDPPDETSRRLWHAVGEHVELLPPDWTLVGGLMVQLHALEHDVPDVRVTVDIDVLGQARPPGPLQAIDRALVDAGFQSPPAGSRQLRVPLRAQRAHRRRARARGHPPTAHDRCASRS